MPINHYKMYYDAFMQYHPISWLEGEEDALDFIVRAVKEEAWLEGYTSGKSRGKTNNPYEELNDRL